MRILFSIITIVAMNSAALAQGTAPAAAPDNLEDKIVCERSDPPTGTRIGATKICHTVGQWREIHRNSQDYLSRIQNSGVGNSTLGSGGGH